MEGQMHEHGLLYTSVPFVMFDEGGWLGVCVGGGGGVVVSGLELFGFFLSFHELWLALSMEADEGAAVEWIETRRQEELAHALDVVVHSGRVRPNADLSRHLLQGFLLADQTPSVRLVVVLEDLMYVWGYSNSSAARFHSQQRDVEELLQCLVRRSLDHRAQRVVQTLVQQGSSRSQADIEDLESVSAIPRESIGPSPDGAAVTPWWTGRKMRCKRGDLYTVHSLLHGRRTCTFEVPSGRGTEHEIDGDHVRL